MYNQDLRKQLPLFYRFFAKFCVIQSQHTDRILGGEFVLLIVIWVSRILGFRKTIPLEVDKHVVFLNLQDPRFLTVPNELTNKDALPAKLTNFLSKGDTFIDVGANHGVFSIVASDLVGIDGLIVTIEPQPQLAQLVEHSLAANAKAPYQVHRIACTDEEGSTEFFIPTTTSGSAGRFSSFSALGSHRKLRVPMKRFDEAVDWKKFPGQKFIKLDVEGSELMFLRGAASMIRAINPPILLEINPSAMKAAGVSGGDLISTLSNFGYQFFISSRNILEDKPLDRVDMSSHQNIIVSTTRLHLNEGLAQYRDS
jgi:FkbM family methyltransferase